MDTFKVSSEEKRKIITKYLNAGFTQSDMGRILGISKQLVWYWVNRIKIEQEKPKIRKPQRDGVV